MKCVCCISHINVQFPRKKCLLAYLAIINCKNKFWWRQAYLSTMLHAEFAYMSAFRLYYKANKLYLVKKKRSKCVVFLYLYLPMTIFSTSTKIYFFDATLIFI